ncbi:MAG: NTP transferase domain-containing protein [Elusimicrobia bacterium]|nr:NTP transferase domain-containing protein [Elusimicrobiota bacterium]
MSGLRVRLLAAGRGRRAGGPKAWGLYGGKALLEVQVGFLATVTAPENIDVAIQGEWLERCRELSPRVNWVAADPEGAALSSLQALLKAAPRARSFVIHVDMPVFDLRVWRALAAVPGDAVPVYEGRRGHPVLLTAQTLDEVARLDPATGRLDQFLRGRTVTEVPVATDVILANLNEGLK